jgi:hypothetical protein
VRVGRMPGLFAYMDGTGVREFAEGMQIGWGSRILR